VDPRAGLNDMEKRKFLTLPGLELRPLRLPARSHRLRYPSSFFLVTNLIIIYVLFAVVFKVSDEGLRDFKI
jgi:hypothetical protein